jgi:hypothetical protein
MTNFKGPAPRQRQERRTMLDRILDTPNLEHVVPRLQPGLIHRIIETCGLEDCGELIMLATPGQLTRIFDLDLWRSAEPGMDEQFDGERFGVWLEVLAESSPSMAAQKLAEMDPDLVTAGLAQHARVFDCAVVTPYTTTDGIEATAIQETGDGLSCEIGGYRLVAKRTDSWHAIVEILIALDAAHPGYFHQVMHGCRTLSNSGYERDGLHDILADADQIVFDLAVDRERRRDKRGYVTPAQARVFLEMSRRVPLESAAIPPANPIAGAYFRSINQKRASHAESRSAPASKKPKPSLDSQDAAAALVNVLLDAGIIAQQPRALLTGPQAHTATLVRIKAHMQFVFDCDPSAYATRNEELTYLANALMAGCALQGRPFTAQEAWDAAVAVCNLGLENWPPQWTRAQSLPEDFLVTQDLVTVFQTGWTVLHKEAGMYAAKRLLEILAGLRCNDRHIRSGLDRLRRELSASCRAGMPWRARGALDVLAILDAPAGAALRGLIDEFPVLHGAVSASTFEFISENSQIASIREFMNTFERGHLRC